MSTPTPTSIFDDLAQRIAARPQLIDDVGGVFQFDVAGDEGGTWVVDLRDAPGGVTTGPRDDADCVISVRQDDFVGIMSGAVDPQMAFMMGKIRLKGDFGLATKLRHLM